MIAANAATGPRPRTQRLRRAGQALALYGRRITRAVGGWLRETAKGCWEWWTRGRLVAALATLLLVGAAYFTVYQVFLVKVPLATIAPDPKGGDPTELRYWGVSNFQGVRLRPGETQEFSYRVPRVLALGTDRRLEFFLRTALPKDAGARLGRIVITQGEATEPFVYPLQRKDLQRFTIPWDPPNPDGVNPLTIQYQPPPGSSTDAGSVIVASEVKSVGLWPYALVLALAGFGLLVVATLMKTGPQRRVVAILVVGIGLMAWVHSGAIVSNVLFEGNGYKLSGMAQNTAFLLAHGEFDETMYRGTGIVVVPLAAAILDGPRALETGFADVYPGLRFVMFLWTAAALGFLLVSLYRNVRPSVALFTGVVFALCFPLAVDLYAADADAYFIPLFTMMMGAFFYFIRSPRLLPASALILAFGVLVMLSIKVTPAFLIALIPGAVWVQTLASKRTWRDRRALGLVIALVIGGLIGNALSSAFYPPDRNVGVPGVAFQRSVLFHILWAASARNQPENPYGFTKSPSERNAKVAEVTGLPAEVTYIRQSQLATDVLYRPGFVKMLKERPGYYYGVSAMRGYNDALLFTHSLLVPYKKLLEKGAVKGAAELNKFDQLWKVAPTFYLSAFLNENKNLLFNLVLLVGAVIGILAFRRWDVGVLLLGVVIANVLFMTWIHAQDRYLSFTLLALVIGLAVTVPALLRAVWAAGARETGRIGD
jgi:hypothetical protein